METPCGNHTIAICNSSSFGRTIRNHLERLRRIGRVIEITVEGDCHGERLAEQVDGADYIITSGTPHFDATFFACSPDIRLIARDGLGYDNVDLAAAQAAGVYVTAVEGPVEREAVAELTMVLLMNMCRPVAPATRAAREGRWLDRGSFIGTELKGKTLGIIGCGNIGMRVAEISRGGFGMRVIANDPIRRSSWAREAGVDYVELCELLESSDVITLHATLNPTSYQLISRELLARVRQGALLVNTARGALVDQDAVIEALDAGTLSFYGTDALCVEPPAADDRLLTHPRVLVTPHIGAYTREALRGMGDKVVSDVECVASGGRPTNIVAQPAPLIGGYHDARA